MTLSHRRTLAAASLAFAWACQTQPEPGTGDDGSSGAANESAPTPAATTDDDASTSGAAATTDAAGDTSGTTEIGTATFAVDEGVLPPEYCPEGAEVSLEVGLGDVDFRPIDSGPAQLIQGHQGGYHVVLGLRGTGFDLADWGEGHLYATVGGEVVADYDTIVVMNCSDAGDYSEALWLNLIFETNAPALLGQVASVQAQFTDISGQVASVEAEITISETVVHQ
ncbi:MAG: hypothetical protein AAF799_17245 [Myxococcota bacterium]